jgi:hypothetical protein
MVTSGQASLLEFIPGAERISLHSFRGRCRASGFEYGGRDTLRNGICRIPPDELGASAGRFLTGFSQAGNELGNIALIVPVGISEAIDEFPFLEHQHQEPGREHRDDEDV